MKEYLVISEISYAARTWNPGEIVSMPSDRAAKYLKQNSIKPVAAATQEEDE